MKTIPEINREPVLSVLALEIERGLDCGYEIRRRSNVDIISSMILSKYEVAYLVQKVLDHCDDQKEITRRVLTDLHKWYTMRWRLKTPVVSVHTIIENVFKEENLS